MRWGFSDGRGVSSTAVADALGETAGASVQVETPPAITPMGEIEVQSPKARR
jgi:hypothetical protein